MDVLIKSLFVFFGDNDKFFYPIFVVVFNVVLGSSKNESIVSFIFLT
jgi:hypothetical protein